MGLARPTTSRLGLSATPICASVAIPDQISPLQPEQVDMKTILSHAHLIDCVEPKV
jgi:hypothetical protein